MHHEELGQEGLGEMALRVQVFMKVGRWRWGLVRLWQQPVRNLCVFKKTTSTNKPKPPISQGRLKSVVWVGLCTSWSGLCAM